MLNSVFGKTVFDRRRSMIGWTAGIAAFVVIAIAFYPTIADQRDQFEELFASYPESLLALLGVDDISDILSPVGYLNSQLFANVVPLIVLIFAIGAGTAATAGEEKDGTLDLLLAQPVARSRIVVEKFAATAALLAVIMAVSFVLLLIGGPIVDLDVTITGLIAIHFTTILFGLLFTALAMFVGGLTGKRGITLGLTSAVAVVSFFVYGLFPIVDTLEPHQDLSPFYWLLGPNPLANGLAWGWIALLGGFTVVLVAGALWAFGNRDVGT